MEIPCCHVAIFSSFEKHEIKKIATWQRACVADIERTFPFSSITLYYVIQVSCADGGLNLAKP